MAEIQLLGLTHYPPFAWADDHMAGIMQMILSDPSIPADAKDPANWTEEMRAEWGDDAGKSAAPAHRRRLVDGLDRVRAALDAFDPDVILIWGDDQYENFREDLIPPYSILAYGDREVRPYEAGVLRMFPSYWDEPADMTVKVKGRPDVGRWLTERLLAEGFDVPYAYQPRHEAVLPHAFMNTVLFLDHRRTGFPWPIVCMPINCYGRKVIASRGGWRPFADELELDPPSPPPWRLMDLGAATAKALADSPWKVSIAASSSWSHAFLTDHTWRLRPDTPADRELYDALLAADYSQWRATTTEQIEHAGQQEVLNWFALLGAAGQLDADLSWSTFVETSVFNSNKVFAVWEPTTS